ncbi:MAG TPA: PEP-utilizing enzyme [Pseudonocardia sp.]|nr:PEP-utilizing enzyme [Pseudonocardia sp.]
MAGGLIMDGFEQVGTGLTVYEDDTIVEGPVRWLDSPAAVIDFVNSGRVSESIVLARGGTTTFLTPALTGGVKGVMTLQGAPESHLGILSREYGIPCLMSVAFTEGVRSSRGEVIPADGTIVRLDVSTSPNGRVFAQAGAVVDDSPPRAPSEDAPKGPSEEEMAQIQHLLHNYRGEFPHGPEGEQRFRASLGSAAAGVLNTGDDERDLTRDELNQLSEYMGYNLWDCLALRTTEGESGLIPRQEYEAVSLVQIWQRYPELMRFITDEVGVDGLHEIGGLSRREVGTKVNLLHIWGTGFPLGMGRAIAMALGRIGGNDRETDLRESMQFMRRLFTGLRGPGEPMFNSMRGNTFEVLEPEWLTRFRDERQGVADRDDRVRRQRFSATTELMGFLTHFDNRLALHDSGPYPVGDGEFMIVRDHFLSDEFYHWGDLTEDLPHAVTQAMFFRPDAPLEVAINDIGTVFTKPANYLKHLTGMTVYARDRWDSPVSEIRTLDDTEMDSIEARCREASTRLYKRIAAMPTRDKIAAGVQVYYTEFIAPFARAAGLWERMKTEFDFHEWDPLTSEAYYSLVKERVAEREFPRMVLGGAFPPVRDPITPEEAFPALHLLALRGSAQDLPVDGTEMVNAGYVSQTLSGYLLTDTGKAVHERLLAAERRTYDTDRLAQAYERFLAQNGPLKALVSRWQSLGPADEGARAELLAELSDIMGRVRVALRRTNEQLLRFEGYLPRLRKAMSRAEEGEVEYIAGPSVESVHTVWMELHEDYLLTQGITREQEGSY